MSKSSSFKLEGLGQVILQLDLLEVGKHLFPAQFQAVANAYFIEPTVPHWGVTINRLLLCSLAFKETHDAFYRPVLVVKACLRLQFQCLLPILPPYRVMKASSASLAHLRVSLMLVYPYLRQSRCPRKPPSRFQGLVFLSVAL